MPAKKATTPATTATKSKKPKVQNPLFEKKTKNYGIGNDVQPKRDLSRFLKWPKYVRLQRQRRILMHRLKVPPTVNQFTRTLDKNSATNLFKLLNKYKPESDAQKKERLLKAAEAKTKDQSATAPASKDAHLHYGINKVTRLVERKEAKLVVIAHDVTPLELVLWLPTVCRKLNVPYVVVKGKARLGAAVHKKNCCAVAFTGVEKEDVKELQNLTDLATSSFNNNVDLRRIWGGGNLGIKASHVQKKREAALAKENKNKQI